LSTSQRIRYLDLARCIAVIAMIFYHFVYDLGHFGYVNLHTVTNGSWKIFAQSIGTSFLFISGYSFWIMAKNELDIIKFVKRFTILLGAALLISAATYFQDSRSFVFFGILHLLAACSILGIIIYKLPIVLLVIIAAILAFTPEYYFSSLYYSHSLFEPKYMAWTGLYNGKTGSVDFYAFMPWSSSFVLGLSVAKLFVGSNRSAQISPLIFKEEKTSLLISIAFWIGRNALIVYLIHQPILFAAFLGFNKVMVT